MKQRAWAAGAITVAMLVNGCASDANEAEWLEYRSGAESSWQGRTFYRVERDLGFETEEELRAYYDEHVAHRSAASADVGAQTAELLVNTVDGRDDVLSREDAIDLRFCISTEFGNDYARALAEVSSAASSWMSVANVRFIHVPAADGDCTPSNDTIDVPVRPWSAGGACAFFPSGGGCVRETLVMDFDDFDTSPEWDTLAPNLTTTGVFRHELGHVLGFRHEHVRPEAQPHDCQSESKTWRELTGYDRRSLMHYQWCNGVTERDLRITPLDAAGSIALYGMSSALVTAVL